MFHVYLNKTSNFGEAKKNSCLRTFANTVCQNKQIQNKYNKNFRVERESSPEAEKQTKKSNLSTKSA